MSKSLVRLRLVGSRHEEFTIDVGGGEVSLPKLMTLHMMSNVLFAGDSGDGAASAFAKLVSACHALEDLGGNLLLLHR